MDIGFLPMLDYGAPAGIAVRPVASWPLCLGMSRRHPLALRSAVEVKRLRGEPFVLYSGSEDYGSLSRVRSLCGFEPRIAYQTDNVLLMMTLVGAGLGVGLFPVGLADLPTNHQQKLAFRSVSGIDAMTEYAIAFRRDETEEPVMNFIESLGLLTLMPKAARLAQCQTASAQPNL